jgi:hypothetical protein
MRICAVSSEPRKFDAELRRDLLVNLPILLIVEWLVVSLFHVHFMPNLFVLNSGLRSYASTEGLDPVILGSFDALSHLSVLLLAIARAVRDWADPADISFMKRLVSGQRGFGPITSFTIWWACTVCVFFDWVDISKSSEFHPLFSMPQGFLLYYLIVYLFCYLGFREGSLVPRLVRLRYGAPQP